MKNRPKTFPLDPVIKLFLTPEEAADVVTKWGIYDELKCVLLHSLPFRCARFGSEHPSIGDANQAWFDIAPFNLDAQNSTVLAISSPESLRFRLPKRTQVGLVEGSLGSVAMTPRRKRLWTSVVGSLLSQLKRGMWVRNTSNRKAFFVEDHYYSSRSEELHRSGVPLVASSGSDVYFPEMQPNAESR